ncbi:MAG: hypothetical protein IKH39_04055 [Candidatus Methanomethylophilaceae archaeon]|nr:hypothetical protein [Candidatus Methanomethylophilaceae archaeon]
MILSSCTEIFPLLPSMTKLPSKKVAGPCSFPLRRVTLFEMTIGSFSALKSMSPTGISPPSAILSSAACRSAAVPIAAEAACADRGDMRLSTSKRALRAVHIFLKEQDLI